MYKPGKNIFIGEGHDIDPSAMVGYKPDRHIEDLDLKIGRNARVRSGSVIYLGSQIGDDLSTGHGAVIREENKIGDGLNIWANSVIDYGCIIGSDVKIHCNSYICQFTVIEDGVFIGPGVRLLNDLHPPCGCCMRGPSIGKKARIGGGAVILPGITIGEEALVGAGSVVVKDVPLGMAVIGNPAKILCPVDELRCKSGKKEKPYE